MKEKLFKYFRHIILILLTVNLIGLYFIYTAEFRTATHSNALDFIPTIAASYENYRSVLSWVALACMSVAWILWELAISKSGKRIYAFISMGLFFVQMILILNMLSIISILWSLFLMSYYTYEKIEWKNSIKNTEAILINAAENKENNRKFMDLFKRKPKSTSSDMSKRSGHKFADLFKKKSKIVNVDEDKKNNRKFMNLFKRKSNS